jgi:RNA polymerase sigma factor (TIGR02999 family)
MAHEVTRLLERWNGGDASALDDLMPVVYTDLHRLAASYVAREAGGSTATPTVIINELYLKLAHQHSARFEDRLHFFGAAACLIRRILVDQARKRRAEKRGDGRVRVTLQDWHEMTGGPDVDMIELDMALTQLSAMDPQQGRIVDLRYFCGMSVDETAGAMGISTATVKRDWAMAKAWLYRRLTAGEGGSEWMTADAGGS